MVKRLSTVRDTWVRSLGQEDPLEKEMGEDEMVGWHHQLNGSESEQTLGDGEGQGGQTCCSSWSRKELDT